MRLNVTKVRDNRIEFKITGIDTAMANALRRIIISEIPIMAIENVTFYENSSILDDEVLAHRLGLIPLKTYLDGPERIKLSLKATGPGTVYSKEIKVKETKIKGKSIPSESIAVYDRIPIVKLTENQEINLEATAELGFGKDHVKWQGGLASYDTKDGKSFEFFIESYGQLTIKEMIQASFDILNKKISEFKSHMK